MKKVFVFVLMFWIGTVWAKDSPYQDWRATETCTTDTRVVLSTVTVYIKDVLVTSGSALVSQFQYYDSTTTDSSLDISTSPIYDIKTVGTLFPIDEYSPLGFAYTKTGGGACIKIRWQWPYHIPDGRERYNYK